MLSSYHTAKKVERNKEWPASCPVGKLPEIRGIQKFLGFLKSLSAQ
jgi:hypothetical protein